MDDDKVAAEHWEAANWESLQAIFHLVQSTPAAERTAVLHQATSDARMRQRVEALLGASTESEVSAPPSGETVPLGSRVGPYAVLRHLGTGGLGSVYLCERLMAGAVQQCAVKVLSMHAAGASFQARFKREQQILASLDHPDITRLYEAGMTENGQPYLAMEYVDGVDLTRYCDEHRLTVSQRVALFLHICDAVAYAHRNLTVHLDLKPSNILVTADGVVKLLDFGTAKLLDPDGGLTTTIMATPAYASPEQLRGQAVTTSCDLYSLGAVLFELLSGKRPYRDTSMAVAVERAIKEEEPSAITTAVTDDAAQERSTSTVRLRQTLEGDLATIVARCLRSRPTERYVSVDALAEDLRRYLQGRPVLARPQTQAYRLGKFIRRNRTLVTAGMLAALAIVLSVTYALYRERQATRDARRATQMQTFLYRLLYVANANYTGKPTFTVPDFLELGARLVPDYVTNPADLRRAQLGLAESMFENDDTDGAAKVFTEVIHSAKNAQDFDSEAEAEATAGFIAYQKGNVPLADAMTAHALELSHRRDASASVRVWSAVYYAMVREESGSRTEANLHMLQHAIEEANTTPLPPREVADTYYNLALAYRFRGRYEDSETAYRHALQTYDQDPQAHCDRADVRLGIASDEENLGNDAESLLEYNTAWAESKQCSGENSRNSLRDETSVAEGLLRAGRSADALLLMQQVLPALRSLGTDRPYLARPTRLLGQAYVDRRAFAAADTLFRAFAVRGGGAAEETKDPELGLLELIWARASQGRGDRVDALAHARNAQRLLPAGQGTPTQKAGAAQASALVANLSH